MVGTVLVTGGCGFIGTWVLRELFARDAQPIVLDPQPHPERWARILGKNVARVIRAETSLLDRDAIRETISKYQITHVIHLAALLTPACQQDPWRGCEVNIMGSMALLDAARLSRQVRCVSYASSYAVYGPETGAEALTSNRPPSFYGAFKQAVDLIAEQYWKHFQLASVAIRPHVVYGPERDQGLTAGPSLACRAAARGERYCIPYEGRLGYDYVEDVARAFVRGALECSSGAHVVDLPGEMATSGEFVRAIETVVPEARGNISVDGPAIPANIPPQPNYISTLFPDWKPTPLLEGVKRTIDYYRDGGQA